MSVAIRTITRLQDADDINVSLGAGVDEYALVYDHDTARFVLRAPAAPFAGLLATGATVGATEQAQMFVSSVGIGAGLTTPLTPLHVVYDDNSVDGINPRCALFDSVDNTIHSVHLEMRKARGARGGTLTKLVNGDFLGGVVAAGYDGSRYTVGGVFSCSLQSGIDATPGVMPATAYISTGHLTSGMVTPRLTINSSGVGFGLSASTSLVLPSFSVHAAGNNFVVYDQYSADTSGANFIGRKARGSMGAPTAALSGDTLTALLARGYHSGGFGATNVAGVILVAAENFTSSNQGTHIVFGTTPLSSISREERMRITSAGFVGIGTTAPATRLDIDAGALTMKEMTAPTGVADKAMLYTKDNGSGKTQLCCKLGDDVEIVLATQA